MPDNFTKWFTNDRAASNIYKVNENGVVDTSRSLCKVRFVWDNNVYPSDPETPFADRIILNLFDAESGEPLDKFMPPSGLYCLRLADGLFTGVYKSLLAGASEEFVNSNPFDYYYEVLNTVGIPAMESIPARNSALYTLTGIKVADEASSIDLRSLPAGVYILNGKKVLKK